jgi:hypothetical protein
MNERIKEIREQAWTLVSNEERERGELYEAREQWERCDQKFAELIMKEYEKLLPETCPWADADKEGPMKGWHVQFVARKHFGVEE